MACRSAIALLLAAKMIVLGLQAHNYWGGLISYFNADRGGQAYAYKPELP